MSGPLIFTGMLTNDGNNELKIEDYLDFKIRDLIIHNIPLSISNTMTTLKTIGKILNPYFHSALTPTLSHIAIQLNVENTKDVFIIEYGQYYSKNSNLKESIFSSSKSSKEPRKSLNKNDYYYINDIDGARLTKFSYEFIKSYNDYDEYMPKIITKIIAKEFYNTFYEGIFQGDSFSDSFNNFFRVECDVKNKISLRELCDNFKGEKWLAKKYNVAFHNCQNFGAEVVKILKAIRIHELDKVRIAEKNYLPSCIIKVLWQNEKLSLTNTLGRIPVFGFFYDLYKCTRKEFGEHQEKHN